MKQILERLTPPTALSILTAVLSLVVAFGAPVSEAQSHAILVFGGSLSLVLFAHGLSGALTYLSPQSIAGLVTGVIGVAVSFGAPITQAQSESVLQLTALFGALLLVHGAVHTIARDRRAPEVNETSREHDGPPLSRGDFAFTNGGGDAPVRRRGLSALIRGTHPLFKVGLRPPKNAPAILLRDILTGVVPEHPAVADHFGKLPFGLYNNDKFGVCGPTSLANLVRLLTGGLLGKEVVPSQEDVYDLYRRSGNPTFNPVTDVGDNGVDMQTMLEAAHEGGIGDGNGGKIKPLAFAKVDVTNDEELEAAVSIFGGILFGVSLDEAQQGQTQTQPPEWEYKSSPPWGGHAVLAGAFRAAGLIDVISWALRVITTTLFRRKQLQEAWVVIFEWHLEHPAFQAGVDVEALRMAYKYLTGRELPTPTPPAPSPTPAPAAGEGVSDADRALWANVKDWVNSHRHSGRAKAVAGDIAAWAEREGLT